MLLVRKQYFEVYNNVSQYFLNIAESDGTFFQKILTNWREEN